MNYYYFSEKHFFGCLDDFFTNHVQLCGSCSSKNAMQHAQKKKKKRKSAAAEVVSFAAGTFMQAWLKGK